MRPREGLRVLANRGASGIDGLVSTALGVAVAGTGPAVALLGDLSYLYDLGAVAWNARRGVDATLVVVRNGGGHIFSAMAQRDLPEHRSLFVTPHDTDLGALTSAAGAAHVLVERAGDLGSVLSAAMHAGGLHVVEVTVDPDASLARREGMRAAIGAAID
jgi:2-succinyl-5-enolpyruvyl-6-hydroxy-3-cyclohexene-1-carboxylate synthase